VNISEMCERVCRAEGVLWRGKERDMMVNMWWETRECREYGELRW